MSFRTGSNGPVVQREPEPFVPPRFLNGNGNGIHTPSRKSLNWLRVGVPLLVGAFIAFAMYFRGQTLFIPSVSLFAYGLSLLQWESTDSFPLKILGYGELLCALLACAIPEYGLWWWGFGFGFLHLAYVLLLIFIRRIDTRDRRG
jgi:hypothetical protein